MSSIRLTVGIPTFNRCAELRQALDSVMPQVDTVGSVDVLVVDNASTDKTAEVVREYQERYPQKVGYRRNSENIGFSANVDAVVKSARGEYVLVLSDDDALEVGALKRTLDVLAVHRVAALFLGVSAWNRDLSAPLKPQPAVPESSGKLYANGSDYVIGVKAFPPGCISGYVVERKAWSLANALDFRGTLVVQVLTVLRMARNSPVYASDYPHVRFRTENMNGDVTFYQTPLSLLRHRVEPLEFLSQVVDGYSQEAVSALRRNVMRSIIYNVVADDKCRQADFGELEKRVVAANGRFNTYTMLLSVLLRAPSCVVRLCRKALGLSSPST